MDEQSGGALRYLAPPTGSFWRWSADGERIEWFDGPPIATRDELEVVLGRLAPYGLPPMGAIVLLLSACDGGWRSEGRGRAILDGFANYMGRRRRGRRLAHLSAAVSEPVTEAILSSVGTVMRGLDGVGALAPDLRATPTARGVLVETAFEAASHRTSPALARAVVETLSLGLDPRSLDVAAPGLDLAQTLLEDLKALEHGLEGLRPERLACRLRTGLDGSVGPAPIDLVTADAVRALLAALSSDRDMAGLSRLALDIMAAIHVPHPLTPSPEVASGGLSGITSRGPLDRLLISELAHDDTTLAARIALGEALYLRREVPPRSPTRPRAILLDSGIRMWGVPRVYATAVALALAATADRRARLLAFRANGPRAVPVALATRPGLADHLACLVTDPHPGAAIADFCTAVCDLGPDADRVVVTHPDALTDPEFRQALHTRPTGVMYVATVDRDGSFGLQAVSRRGQRAVCGARLSLDSVLGTSVPDTARAVPLLETSGPPLPVALMLERFPLLLSHPIVPARAAARPGLGVLAVLGDGRVMHWWREDRGMRSLTDRLPGGRVHGVFLDPQGVGVVLAGTRPGGASTMLTVDLSTGALTWSEIPLAGRRPPGVFMLRGVVVLVIGTGLSGLRLDAFHAQSGRRVPTPDLLPAGIRWVGRRTFRSDRRWYVAAQVGSGVSLQPVAPRLDEIEDLFDREGLDGPWALTSRGRVHSTLTGHPVVIGGFPTGDHRLVGHLLSGDGHRIRMQLEDASQVAADPGHATTVTLVVDLQSGLVGPAPSRDPVLDLEPEIARAVKVSGAHAPLRRYAAVGRGDPDELVLLSPGQRHDVIRPTPDGASLALERGRSDPGRPGRMVPFERADRRKGSRIQMRIARLEGGLHVWLDPRGLLHLVAGDPARAEITLVLVPGTLGGWATRGGAFGPAYWTGVEPARPYGPIVREFLDILRGPT